MHPNRAFLFTPGNHPRRVEKVFVSGADAAILDLEDAVAVAEKPAARHAVVEALQRPRQASCRAYVRVNAADTPFCYGDLTTVVGPGLDGIMLPKVEDARTLFAIDWLIAQLERERGLPPGGIDLLPIVETGKGMAAVDEIARAGTRVRRLSFGAGDYTLDMGLTWTPEEAELAHARSTIVLASRAAGLEAPIDTVFARLDQPDALRRSAETAAGLGFQGKLCIHPAQIEPVRTVFSPAPEEVARARRVIEAFEAAEASGSASIQIDGQFVDYPIVERARRVLATVAMIERAG